MDDIHELYKPNSLKYKSESTEEKKDDKRKIRQVSSSPARIRKKSPGKKFLEAFISDDIDDIKDYIIYDVIVPSIMNTVLDTVTNGIQMLFWGDKGRKPNISRSGGKTYVSYGSYSSDKRSMDNISRARHNFDDLVLDSRGEAEEVLSQLVDLTLDYGHASVSDFYYMNGISSTPIDQKWGWKDLSNAKVERVRDGYIIKLPRAVLIN